ncbi:MAG: signal peptidase I [Candidatus Dadabacteria bacterium]|nr:signal peptidase I [Candidatus Dadabacteria bacterium]
MNYQRDKISAINECRITDCVLDLWQEIGKETQLKLSGMSMLPFIKNGDSVVVRHTREGIGVGSIVAFRKEQEIIIHRVIRMENKNGKTAILTKGDFNVKADNAFDEDYLVGRVIGINKGGRQINLDTYFWSYMGRLISSCSLLLSLTSRFFYFKILKRNFNS